MPIETLGHKLKARRLEVEPSIRHNIAVIRSLNEEIVRLKDELVSGLTAHEGQIRNVWGRALIHGAITKENADVEGEPLKIVKAGLATPDEVERFSVVAVVKTIQDPEDSRIVRFFDPFQHRFDIQPIELDVTQPST
jgi:hypothetical protein